MPYPYARRKAVGIGHWTTPQCRLHVLYVRISKLFWSAALIIWKKEDFWLVGIMDSGKGDQRLLICCNSMIKWVKFCKKGMIWQTLYTWISKMHSVPHARLAVNLNAMTGVRGTMLWMILHWIRSYLHCREQRMNVRGAASSLAEMTSEVPQGSVLRPLLLFIYINDLPVWIPAFINMLLMIQRCWRNMRE